MALKDSQQRVAFSPKEFAELFGKEQTWGYRQIYAGKVKTVTEYGRMMIPASEVEKILGKADVYTERKTKPKAPPKMIDPWKEFLEAKRRKVAALAAPASTKAGKPSNDARAGALARLTKKR